MVRRLQLRAHRLAKIPRLRSGRDRSRPPARFPAGHGPSPVPAAAPGLEPAPPPAAAPAPACVTLLMGLRDLLRHGHPPLRAWLDAQGRQLRRCLGGDQRLEDVLHLVHEGFPREALLVLEALIACVLQERFGA